jgi:glycosyltransferase involved in cell wall biosynthesis
MVNRDAQTTQYNHCNTSPLTRLIGSNATAMKISIVIATFNAARHLRACLESCITQTWPNKEIIVIDGASTDGTVDVIRQYAAQIAYWKSEADTGIYDAWNKALPHVTGEWVLFRGADDLFWDENTLEKAAPSLETASSSELICYGTVVSVNEHQEMVGIRGTPWKDAKDRFFHEMPMAHPGVFHHIALFQRFGRFDTSYRIAGDYDFLLRAVKGAVEGKFLAGVIVTKMSGGGISNTQGLRTKRESIKALKKNGVADFPLAQYSEMAMIVFLNFRRRCMKIILGPTRYERFRRLKLRGVSERVGAKALVVLLQGVQSK